MIFRKFRVIEIRGNMHAIETKVFLFNKGGIAICCVVSYRVLSEAECSEGSEKSVKEEIPV